TGGTEVRDGTLIGSAASIRGDLVNAGTTVFDQPDDATFAGTVTGDGGAMIKRGTGDLTLSGTSNLDWTIESGGLVTTASSFGGDAVIQPEGRLAFDQDGDATYAGRLSGSGAFDLSGAGVVTLT